MRQRHAARPTLESVEDRLVLSSAGAFDPTAQIRSALGGLFAHHSHATPARAGHHAAAARRHGSAAGRPHHPRVTAPHHPHHHHPSSSSSSSSSLTSSLSNFFKSMGL